MEGLGVGLLGRHHCSRANPPEAHWCVFGPGVLERTGRQSCCADGAVGPAGTAEGGEVGAGGMGELGDDGESGGGGGAGDGG